MTGMADRSKSCALLAAALCTARLPAFAQSVSYPVKPVGIIVPHAPGG